MNINSSYFHEQSIIGTLYKTSFSRKLQCRFAKHNATLILLIYGVILDVIDVIKTERATHKNCLRWSEMNKPSNIRNFKSVPPYFSKLCRVSLDLRQALIRLI